MTTNPTSSTGELPAKRTRSEPESGGKHRQTPVPTINDTNKDYQVEDGDITLISSDNFHFRIHSYHLMAASSVFRDMIRAGTPPHDRKEVAFTDTKTETGRVIKLFLDICYAKTLRCPKKDDLEDGLGDLVTLLNKYNCKLAWNCLELSLDTWMRQEMVHNDDVFRLAVKADDKELAALAVELSNGDVWQMTIPDQYKYALLRASRCGNNLVDPESTDWKEVSKEFKKIMAAFREPKK
ncbi:hypothetical protein I317_02831 [Kwoniella heveanensis CBS 569]|uniref:BTB domain-containing protein n=1 Tax=Kwoniella heveanensis BCC8398 TaxID=1296120 RepID=A0A1B9GRK5_9TREE|nr:hypothetical protein I316_04737 [Kwoniella heveanensis BCC8398]OCF43263.1 hypothetical protein I317_02831 [Kwoniella heveanensis CBS 569]